MNQYIKQIAIIAFCILGSIFGATTQAQTPLSDIGVVWEKSYMTGNAINMKTNRAKDGYVVCGNDFSAISKNGIGRNGVVMEIDEQGKLIRTAKANIEEVYTPIGDTYARFKVAFKTDDGGILAFGDFGDKGAPLSEKTTNYTGLPASENYLLQNGCWLVKFDKDMNIVKKERLRGALVEAGDMAVNGNIVIAGLDAYQTTSGNMISMIRIFDQDGNLLNDARANYSHMTAIYQYPGTNNFIASSNTRIMKINISASNSISISDVKYITTLGLTNLITPYINNISPTADGGLFLHTNLNSNSNPPINFQNGQGLYRLGADYSQKYYFTKSPYTESYMSPLYLGNNIYVGTLNKRAAHDATQTTNIYQLTDNGTFDVEIGDPLPTGTTIRAVSSSDGFFSIGCSGKSPDGLFKVVKLSTCAKFKVTTLPNDMVILKPYEPFINITLPIIFEGAKGSVDYFLKAVVKSGVVNGKTVGEELEVSSGIPGTLPGGTGVAFNLNRKYDLGTEYAVIEYTLSLKDSYQIAGIDQTCGQTYIFRIVTAPLTDVVAKPTVEKNGTKTNIKAAMKNIGKATFDNYKVTIYKGNMGNSVKHTYTYPGKIRIGETARFNIEIPASMIGSKVVVSFNDAGLGTQNQIEIYDKQYTYELSI